MTTKKTFKKEEIIVKDIQESINFEAQYITDVCDLCDNEGRLMRISGFVIKENGEYSESMRPFCCKKCVTGFWKEIEESEDTSS